MSGSTYRITSGGTTSRCPSLVNECPGRQAFDGFNDVGWARLGGSALGVKWYSTSIDEADMAINMLRLEHRLHPAAEPLRPRKPSTCTRTGT